MTVPSDKNNYQDWIERESNAVQRERESEAALDAAEQETRLQLCEHEWENEQGELVECPNCKIARLDHENDSLSNLVTDWGDKLHEWQQTTGCDSPSAAKAVIDKLARDLTACEETREENSELHKREIDNLMTLLRDVRDSCIVPIVIDGKTFVPISYDAWKSAAEKASD